MKKLVSFISMLSIICISNATHSAQYWARTYGGTKDDHATFIHQTTEGGYVVAGYTTSFGAGNRDILVLKLDKNGNITWQKTYGGSGFDEANSIQQTADGGYIIEGFTYLFLHSHRDFWLLKLNKNGNITWQKKYGGTLRICSIYQTADGGYIAAGYNLGSGHSKDILVLKLDKNGNITWQKTYGGSNSDIAYSIQQIIEGGYIVTGCTYSFGRGQGDIWILKLDKNGNITWQKTYGGSGFDEANSIQQTADGGYIVGGNTYSFGAGDRDFWVLKLNGNGSVSWQKTYGGKRKDDARAILQNVEGGYVVAGYTTSFGAGNRDFLVLKLDNNGNAIWQKTYGKILSENAYSIQMSSDEGYVVAGYTLNFGAGKRDIMLLKIDRTGNIPDCDIIRAPKILISNTSVSGQISSAITLSNSAPITNTNIIHQDALAKPSVICCGTVDRD